MPEPDFDKTVFVIMPFGEDGTKNREQNDDTYENIIKVAVERSGLDLKCVRSDDICLPGGVMDDVITYTVSSKYVIADLSDRNPNVFYELGIRDSFDGKTILLCKKGQKLPFDLKDMRTVFYSKDLVKESSKAIEKIRTYLTNMEGSNKPILSPVRKVLGNKAPSILASEGTNTAASSDHAPSQVDPSPEFKRRLGLALGFTGLTRVSSKPNLPAFEYWVPLIDPCKRPSTGDRPYSVGVWYDTPNKLELEEFKIEALSLVKHAAMQNWRLLILVYAFDGVLEDKEAIDESLTKLVVDNYQFVARDSSQDGRSPHSLLTKPTFSPLTDVVFRLFDYSDSQRINEWVSASESPK